MNTYVHTYIRTNMMCRVCMYVKVWLTTFKIFYFLLCTYVLLHSFQLSNSPKCPAETFSSISQKLSCQFIRFCFLHCNSIRCNPDFKTGREWNGWKENINNSTNLCIDDDTNASDFYSHLNTLYKATYTCVYVGMLFRVESKTKVFRFALHCSFSKQTTTTTTSPHLSTREKLSRWHYWQLQ